MSNRRDALIGLGAGAGVAVLSVGALARRRWKLWYDFDEIGASVDALSGSTVRCTSGTLTGQQTEGPFFTPQTPRRRDIRDPDVSDKVLIVAGRVLDSQCRPIAGAVLDFWQTDHAGRYDQQGYRYRGHQHTDSDGRFELVTVRPQAYTAMSIFRTPHIHAKVQGRNTALLTTQLYLPDAVETNARDRGYDPSLAIEYVAQDGSAQRAVFDFVLAGV
jgi:protocatechuate 3,4-dioxygenase beta subunit